MAFKKIGIHLASVNAKDDKVVSLSMVNDKFLDQ